jgi:hypothetical protein
MRLTQRYYIGLLFTIWVLIGAIFYQASRINQHSIVLRQFVGCEVLR